MMNIMISIKVTDEHAKCDLLSYLGAGTDKIFTQIAEITGQMIDAYTAGIDGILAATQNVPVDPQPIKAEEPKPVEEPTPEPEPEPAKEEKPVTLEEVRKALIEVKKTKPAGLKACFDAVGTKSLSATDPALYGALLAKAQEVLHA